ncbi:hypothetical protein [Pedobacter aquatilis]|uniref:hypothetical protein n=1 Tax=Pedobacter aquatilis TaxID=351343 RepID=UPI00293181D7|nr:hypothetical protein [Pedobacter aquatilis]
MAAPSGAYYNHHFSANDPSGQLVNHSRAILQADKATLLSRFYLDDIFPVNDVDFNSGFVGLVYENGNNIRYHNPNRIGALRRRGANGGVQTSYTDGGLNTLAHAGIQQIKITAVNYIKLVTWFKSAYYDGSTEHGYYVKGSSDNTWRKIIVNQDYQGQDTSIYPTEIANTSYNTTQIIYLKPYIINPEGEFLGDEVSFGGTEPIYQFGSQFRTSVCDASNQVSKIIWMDNASYVNLALVPENTNSSTNIYGYKDDEFTLPIDAGYYVGLQGDTTKVFVVGNDGQFTSWIYCTPPEAPKDVNIYLLQQDFGNGTFYGVNAMLSALKTEDVTIIGTIQSFDSNNNGIGGSVGDANFYVTIPAGQWSGSYDTTYQPAFGAAYSKAVVNTITPVGTTFEAHQG